MMTEDQRWEKSKKSYQDRCEDLRTLIKNAERYEVLMTIAQFRDLIEEWKNNIDNFRIQINALLDQMVLETSHDKRIEIQNQLVEKNILSNQLESLIRLPEKMIQNAIHWREELHSLNEEEHKYVRNGNR